MTTILQFKNALRVLLVSLALFGMHASVSAQTTLGIQDFESSPATPTMGYSNSNGGISTGTNSSSGIPASANLFVSGARGFQSNNANALVTFNNVSLTGYTNAFVEFKLAGMSTNGTNGIDGTDLTTVEISVDGGTNWSSEVVIQASAANQRWGFSAGSTTQTYDGDNTPATVSSSTAAGISTVRVNIPNTATQVRVRIRLTTNDATERLVIDDVKVAGTPSNAAPTATVNAISGTLTVGATLTGSYTYNDADGDAQGTSTFKWYRADNNAGLNVTQIPGETATTYTLGAGDINKYIRFGVTPVAATGTSPGTEAFSAYAGPVVTGSNSASTITAFPGFTPGTNVNYAAYTGTDVTGTSYEIAKFNVNDIAGAPDDGLATTLTALTFSLSNFANIEKVALYNDTNAEVQELTAAATLNFTGLNIVAASGGSKAFSIRVTFKAAVTDNAQPQLTVTAATADVSGSFFASANAGGASSSVSGDNNRIEVTATTLAYNQQPTNGVVGANLSPAVTVRAIDGNGNTDVDFTGVVSITSAGPLAGAQNQAAVSGVATFSTISFSAVGSNLTLGANASGLSGATSNTFNISVQAAGLLIFEENFEFTGTLSANGYSATSGTGTNNITATTGNLALSNYGSSSVGNYIAMANNGQDVAKTFASQSGVTTVYASMLVNISAVGTGDYFFSFGSGAISGNLFRGRLYVKPATAGFVNFGITNTGTPAAVYGTTAYPINTVLNVVVKYQMTASNAIISVFVNPNLYTEPATAEVSVTDSAVPADLSYFLLRQGTAASAATLTLDGIRIATNWGTALGNPQYDATATINGGHYNTVTVLDGTLTAAASVTVNNEIHVNNGADFIIPNNINLIQNGTTNNNSGKVTVKRNATMKRLDYVYWGSPVAGQDLKLFTPYTVSPTNAPGFPTPTGASRFYTLDEPTNDYVAITEPLGVSFVAAKGYMLRAPNNFPTTVSTFNGSFHGVPNNGDISINVTKTGSGMNMLSNPYPSTINADLFMDNNPSLETLYFWTHPANPSSVAGANYATYNSVGAAAPSGTTPPSATPNGTIQVGQGFIAKTTTATTINYTNSLRVNNTAGQFFRGTANEKHRIWLNLSSEGNALNQILTGYVSNATNDLDPRFDARLIETGGSKLYNIVSNSEYVIQGRALPFSAEDVVALGFKAQAAGSYTISLDHVDGLFSEGQDIFIKDQLTGVTHDLKDSAYTFATEAGTFNGRFSIVYQNTTLGIENPAVNANSIVVYTKDNTITVNSGNTDMQSVKIFDMRGRLLFERNNINAAVTAVENLNASGQVLVIQVTADHKTISKKVAY